MGHKQIEGNGPQDRHFKVHVLPLNWCDVGCEGCDVGCDVGCEGVVLGVRVWYWV